MTGEFPAQRASNAENISIWWRHHEPDYATWVMEGVQSPFWNELLKPKLYQKTVEHDEFASNYDCSF